MDEISTSLLQVTRASLERVRAAFPGGRVGFDCNADYGQVLIAVDPSPPTVPLEVLLGDDAEQYFWFGDWPIPDFAEHDKSVHRLWEEGWSPHEDRIRDDWMELPPFQESLLRKRFLEVVCQIAAKISNKPLGLDPCVLAADHDEHIRHTVSRLRWAYRGAPSPKHALLASGEWRLHQESGWTNLLAFSHDGQYINNLVPEKELDEELESEGDWSLSDSVLTMTATQTNAVDDSFVWKNVAYQVRELSDSDLNYSKEDGTVWHYKHIT